jgi:hypothetical protein
MRTVKFNAHWRLQSGGSGAPVPRVEACGTTLEVLFFTRWLLKGGQQQFSGLGELFTEPGAAIRA